MDLVKLTRTGQGGRTVLTVAKRALAYKISVATMIEIALWLAIPHAVIGIGWAVLHPDYLAQRATGLSNVLPGGVDAELVAFGETILWWPVLVMLPPDLCTKSINDAVSADISVVQFITKPRTMETLADGVSQSSAAGVSTLPALAMNRRMIALSAAQLPA